jgi:2-keto-4-pentenoate hydratase/2-oxohepta-3-ene-1,7-dioic acid hydratase in catechol pathway
MRVARFVPNRTPTPFLITSSSNALDWQVLDADGVPGPVRRFVRRSLETGAHGEFLLALKPLEDYRMSQPAFVAEAKRAAGFDIDTVAPLPPPVRPRNFIWIGLNSIDHARESKIELPARPLLFAKTSNAVAGQGHRIPIPLGAAQLDSEARLAVVIGRTCRRATVQTALDFVAGYTCANDVSSGDFQFADGQWYRGQCCAGFGPHGPWLVTKSEIPDPGPLKVRYRLNGKVMQDSTTGNLTLWHSRTGRIRQQLDNPGVGRHYLDASRRELREVWVLPASPPVYLQARDIIEVDIQNIGVLRNFTGEEIGNQQ